MINGGRVFVGSKNEREKQQREKSLSYTLLVCIWAEAWLKKNATLKRYQIEIYTYFCLWKILCSQFAFGVYFFLLFSSLFVAGVCNLKHEKIVQKCNLALWWWLTTSASSICVHHCSLHVHFCLPQASKHAHARRERRCLVHICFLHMIHRNYLLFYHLRSSGRFFFSSSLLRI